MANDTESSYQEKITALQSVLNEKEYDLIRTSELGQALLQEINELKDQIYEADRKHGVQVEELQQDIYQWKLKSEADARKAKWLEDEISMLSKSTPSESEDLQEKLTEGMKQEVSKLQRQVNEMQLELEQSLDTEQQLQNQVEQLNSLLEQQMNQTVANVVSQSFNEEETGILHQDVAELHSQIMNLKKQSLDITKEMQKLKMEAVDFKEKIARKDQELEEVQCEASSYITTLEQKITDLLDLKAEIEVQQVDPYSHESKGTSLFSEVEDRRITSEKRVISLHAEMNFLKKSCEIEKQQSQKLQMQVTSLSIMASGNADHNHVSKVEGQILQERKENTELIRKIEQLEQTDVEKSQNFNKEGFTHKMVGTESSGTKVKVNSDYMNYLTAMIKSKRERIGKLLGDLHTLDMLMLDTRNTASKLEQEVYNVECERDKSRNSNLKIKLEMDEVMLKHVPESFKKRQQLFSNVEKIPIADAVKCVPMEDTATCISVADTVKDPETESKSLKLLEKENKEKNSFTPEKVYKGSRVTKIDKADDCVPPGDCNQQ